MKSEPVETAVKQEPNHEENENSPPANFSEYKESNMKNVVNDFIFEFHKLYMYPAESKLSKL